MYNCSSFKNSSKNEIKAIIYLIYLCQEVYELFSTFKYLCIFDIDWVCTSLFLIFYFEATFKLSLLTAYSRCNLSQFLKGVLLAKPIPLYRENKARKHLVPYWYDLVWDRTCYLQLKVTMVTLEVELFAQLYITAFGAPLSIFQGHSINPTSWF